MVGKKMVIVSLFLEPSKSQKSPVWTIITWWIYPWMSWIRGFIMCKRQKIKYDVVSRIILWLWLCDLELKQYVPSYFIHVHLYDHMIGGKMKIRNKNTRIYQEWPLSRQIVGLWVAKVLPSRYHPSWVSKESPVLRAPKSMFKQQMLSRIASAQAKRML